MKTPQVTQALTRHDGLATRLKDARKSVGLKAQELARLTGWNASKVSRIESGQQLPSAEDLQAWAERTGSGDVARDQWRAMLVEAQELRNSFDRRYRHGQANPQKKYNDLYENNDHFRIFEKEWMPRLLHVPDYTRAVVEYTRSVFGGVNDVEEAVAVRQFSVKYLYDPGKTFEFIVHESVLLGAWPARQVMALQLDRLQTALGLPNVRLGILPVTGLATRPTPASFTLYGGTGYIENVLDDVEWLDEKHTTLLNDTMDSLWPGAAEGDDARRIIAAAQERLRS